MREGGGESLVLYCEQWEIKPVRKSRCAFRGTDGMDCVLYDSKLPLKALYTEWISPSTCTVIQHCYIQWLSIIHPIHTLPGRPSEAIFLSCARTTKCADHRTADLFSHLLGGGELCYLKENNLIQSLKGDVKLKGGFKMENCENKKLNPLMKLQWSTQISGWGLKSLFAQGPC